MKNFHSACFLIALFCLAFFSCKKKTEEETPQPSGPTPVLPTTSSFKWDMKYKAGAQDFKFNTSYVNSSNDTFKVVKLLYLISKVKLKKADNTEIALPQNFLVDASSETPLQVENVPFGDYTGITYSIGVDSVTNTLGAQSGPLDAINSMYWSDWGGYINFEIMGTSPSSPTSTKIFKYDINGFRYPYITEQVITHSFGSHVLTIKKESTPIVSVAVDLLELFKNPAPISIASTYNVGGAGPISKKIADNYRDMFTFDAIHN